MWLLVKLNPSFLKESGNPDTPVTTAGVRQTPRWMWESLSILRDRETLFSTITEIDENGLNLYLPVFRSFFFFFLKEVTCLAEEIAWKSSSSVLHLLVLFTLCGSSPKLEATQQHLVRCLAAVHTHKKCFEKPAKEMLSVPRYIFQSKAVTVPRF